MAPLTEAQLDEIQKSSPLVAGALEELLRGKQTDIDSYLSAVIVKDSLPSMRSFFNCHFVRLDGNGRPRIEALAQKLKNKIIDYCIPRKQIEDAHLHYRTHNSTEKFLELETKARRLFLNQKLSGEGGELLLYVLAENYLHSPQLLCKMPLKTNPEMPIHGTDGIHATVDEKSGNLVLYWGESKLYANLNAGIKEALSSIAPFCIGTGNAGSAQHRDLMLLRDNLDLNNPELEAAILRYLNPDDESFNKLEFRGVCLVGFDSMFYPDKPNTKEENAIRGEIQAALKEWKDEICTNLTACKLDSFVLEIFCIPMPAVQSFRDCFLREIGKEDVS